MRLSLPEALTCLLLVSAASGALDAQDRYNVHFRANRYSGQPGGKVTVAIGIDNTPQAITGFSFGVKHDAAKLTAEEVKIGPALQAALGVGSAPDERFYGVNLAPTGGAGLTVGIILSADNPAVVLPAGLDHHVFDIQYGIAEGPAGDTKVDITGDLGAPRVEVILDRNGTAQKPAGPAAVTSTTIGVTLGPPPYLRGDASQSRRLDVSDAIILLDYLFGGSSLPAGAATRENCLAAFNFDGSVTEGTAGVEDGQDINISDAVQLFDYLFRRGAAPPAPFPSCGQPIEPVDASIECKAFNC